MITDENLTNMFEGTIKNEELTTQNLYNYGFSQHDIKALIERGILEREKKGLYKYASLEKLYFYGRKLISLKEREKADMCFERIHELDPNYSSASFQLFLRNIQKRDYDEAFKYIKYLINGENVYYNNDFNFYLYLLSLITKLPDEYRDYVKNLNFDDIKVLDGDKRYSDKYIQNKLRNLALNKNLYSAKMTFEKYLSSCSKMNPKDIIALNLINVAFEVDFNNKRRIINYIKNKEFDEVESLLEENEENHELSTSDEYTLKLVKKLKEIKESKIVPTITIEKKNTLFKAIDGNDFKDALRMSKEYCDSKHYKYGSNPMLLLLEEICNTIDEIKSDEKENSKTSLNLEERKETEENNQNDIKNIKPSIITIIDYLMKNDFENSYTEIDKYLESIGKSEYKFIALNLIKIGVYENDTAFTKAILFLNTIANKEYKFDVSSYVANFYQCINDGKTNKARVYLDIISKADKISDKKVLLDGLEKILENVSMYKNNSEQKEEVETVKDENYEYIFDNPIDEFDEVDSKNVENELSQMDEERRLVEEKYKLLVENRGIIYLEPMPYEKRNKIKEIVKEYDDMVAFSCGKDENRYVVLRYRTLYNQGIDLTKLMQEGNKDYEEKRYKECIEKYTKILESASYVKTFIFVRLGICYAKIKQNSKAIEFLKVATDLSKNQNKKYDFTQFIMELKGEIPYENLKRKENLPSTYFTKEFDEKYDHSNLENIIKFAIDNNIDLETSCEKLNIPCEERDIAKLLYAIEFYKQGELENGDIYYNEVVKTPNKTDNVKELLKYIDSKKKFFKNREEEPKTLRLIKPGKRKKLNDETPLN